MSHDFRTRPDMTGTSDLQAACEMLQKNFNAALVLVITDEHHATGFREDLTADDARDQLRLAAKRIYALLKQQQQNARTTVKK